MLLLYTMGCGRSRTASSANSKDVEKDEENNVTILKNSKSHIDKDCKKEIVNPIKKTDSAQLKNADRKLSESKYSESTPPPRLSHNNVNGTTVLDSPAENEGADNPENINLSPSKTALREKAPPPPSMMLQAKMSSSQLEFFKMLDEKIEMGKDYSSEEDKIQSCN